MKQKSIRIQQVIPFRTRKIWRYCPEKTSVFFLKTDSVTVL